MDCDAGGWLGVGEIPARGAGAGFSESPEYRCHLQRRGLRHGNGVGGISTTRVVRERSTAQESDPGA